MYEKNFPLTGLQMDRTVVLIKPDAVGRGLANEVLSRIAGLGFTLSVPHTLQFTAQDAKLFYQEHRTRKGFDVYTQFMSSGPMLAVVAEGPDAIERIRTLVGSWNPAKAEAGTLRGDYGLPDERGILNVCHSSDSPWAVQREEALIFGHGYIERLIGEFRGFDNFTMKPIEYEHIMYPSPEHAFQAAKTTDLLIRAGMASIKTASEAKAAGQKLKLRDDWAEIKVSVMLEVLRDKFNRHESLRQKLIDTGSAYVQEGNYHGDETWGVNLKTGIGTNLLGRCLMEVRAANCC